MNTGRLKRIFAASIAMGLLLGLRANLKSGWARAFFGALAGGAFGFVILLLRDMVRGGE